MSASEVMESTRGVALFRAVCALTLMVLGANRASAQESMRTQVVQVPSTNINWNADLNVERFDTAIGSLNRVELRFCSGVEGSVQVENLDASSANVNIDFSATTQLLLPGASTTLTLGPREQFSENLDSADGSIDFDGASGLTLDALAAEDATVVTLDSPAHLSFFNGVQAGNPGVFSVSVSSNGTSTITGSGNLITSISTTASARLEVTYYWGPDCGYEGVDEPSFEVVSREYSFATGPDLALALDALVVPTEGVTGQLFQLSWTARNIGGEPALGPWSDRVEFSIPISDNVGVTSTEFEVVVPGGLAPGDEYSQTLRFVMPENLVPFQARVVLDSADEVVESLSYNNASEWHDIDVVDIPRPNLRVAITSQPPTSLRAGDPAALDFLVYNDGEAPTPPPLWIDRVYLVPAVGGQPPATLSSYAWQWPFSSLGLLQNELGGDGSTAGTSYTRMATNLVLPSTIEGEYFLAVATDSSGSQIELDEGDNVAFSSLMTVDPPLLPDLQVESIVPLVNGVPLTDGTPVESGAPRSLRWTIRNVGSIPYPGGTLWARLYASNDLLTDSLDPANNTLLGTVSVSVPQLAVQGDATVDATTSMPVDVGDLPAGASVGTRFKVWIDSSDLVREEESVGASPYWNNLGVSASEHPVNQSPTPNLEPVALSLLPGQVPRVAFPINVQWTVENGGTDGWDVQLSWRDELWISPGNSTLGDADDVFVRSLNESTVYQNGEWVVADYTKATTLELPDSLSSGVHHLIVVVDAADQLFELGGEGDNVLASAGFNIDRSPADLEIVASAAGGSLTPDTVGAPGEAVLLAWTVSNSTLAGTTSESSWYDRVYLSSSPTSLAGAELLESVHRDRALRPGEQYEVVMNTQVPYVSPDDLYLHFIADYGERNFEDDLSDNSVVVPFQVTAIAADLIVESVAATSNLRETDAIVVEWTVKNDGPVETAASSWSDRVYFSDESDLSQATELRIAGSSYRGETLGAGSTYSVTAAFPLPSGLTPGMWYVIVETDGARQVFELDDANNDHSTRSLLQIDVPVPTPGSAPTSQWLPANLVARNVTASTPTVFAGQDVEVSWEVTNEGQGVGQLSLWADSVYLSLDDTLDIGEDIHLGSYWNDEYLDVGETRLITDTFTVPVDASGAWKLIVDVDRYNQVEQSGQHLDDRSVSAGLLQVDAPPLTNLSVADIDLPTPAELYLGAPLELEWTLQNDSLADIPSQLDWTDRFWLVPDGTGFPSPQSIFMGDIRSSAGVILAGAGTHVQDAANANPRLHVPGVQPGQYQVVVQADALLQVPETDEGDNAMVSLGSVELKAIDVVLGADAGTDLPNGAMRWFRLSVPPDRTIDLEFEHDDPSARCEVFVADGYVPVLGNFDLASPGLGAIDPHRQTVRIPRSSGSDYFILARTVSGAGLDSGATLRAVEREFVIESAEPTTVGAGIVTVGLTGAEMWRAGRAEVRSRSNGDVLGVAAGPNDLGLLADGTLLARFDLSGVANGSVDVVVIDTASMEERLLSSGLTVDTPQPFALRAELDLAPNVRRGETGTGELLVRNVGNVDVPFGVVVVGHAGTEGAVGDDQRMVLSSQELTGSVIDSANGRDSWALVVQNLAPGRETRVSLQLRVGSDLDMDEVAVSVAARPENYMTYRASTFQAWSRALCNALFVDPSLPASLSALAQSTDAWDVVVSDAIGSGALVLRDPGVHRPDSPVLNARDVIVGIAQAVEIELSLDPGSGVPDSAVDTALGEQACKAMISTPFVCDSLFPSECPDAVSNIGVTGVFGVLSPVGTACVDTPAPDDPNVKIRPRGVGPTAVVSANRALEYEVHFENRETATAWASLVEIEDRLEPGFNAATVRFHELRVGDTVIEFPENTSSYQGQHELTIDESTTMNVQVSALVDVLTDTVRVRLQAVEPETGLPPTSGDRGLLSPSLPGDERKASGYLTLSVEPDDLPVGESATMPPPRSGRRQKNTARIKFDANAALATNTVENTLDGGGPTSTMSVSTMATGLVETYQFSWSATDVEPLEFGGFPGTGVQAFTLFTATDEEGPWTPVIADTQATTYEFTPPGSGTFAFRVVATDRVGNAGPPSDPVVIDVPFDCNANGIPDELDISNGTETDCNGSGVPDSCELLDGSLHDDNGNGTPDECECLVSNFCVAIPNSTGNAARLSADELPSVSGSLTIRVTGGVPGALGQLFISDGTQQVPRGDGVLCISGLQSPMSGIDRLDANGQGVFVLDLSGPEAVSAGVAPGVTRYFQFWHRDSLLPGGAGYNSTDGLEVTFCE